MNTTINCIFLIYFIQLPVFIQNDNKCYCLNNGVYDVVVELNSDRSFKIVQKMTSHLNRSVLVQNGYYSIEKSKLTFEVFSEGNIITQDTLENSYFVRADLIGSRKMILLDVFGSDKNFALTKCKTIAGQKF